MGYDTSLGRWAHWHQEGRKDLGYIAVLITRSVLQAKTEQVNIIPQSREMDTNAAIYLKHVK